MTTMPSRSPNSENDEAWAMNDDGLSTLLSYRDTGDQLVLSAEKDNHHEYFATSLDAEECRNIEFGSGMGFQQPLTNKATATFCESHESYLYPPQNPVSGTKSHSPPNNRPNDEQILKHMAYTVRMEEDIISSQVRSKRGLEGELNRVYQSEARLRQQHDLLLAATTELQELCGAQETVLRELEALQDVSNRTTP